MICAGADVFNTKRRGAPTRLGGGERFTQRLLRW